MEYDIHSHRNGEKILETEEFIDSWLELKEALNSISDEDIIREFESSRRKSKSISDSINKLIDERLTSKKWIRQPCIFQDDEYLDKRWRLDFAKPGTISIEVAFNHGEAIAWNLLKPVLASELNHVKKAIETKIGVVIVATEDMKDAGGFDSAVGSYEKVIRYLKPLNYVLTVPMVIIGLKRPKTFKITQISKGGKKIGLIRRLPRRIETKISVMRK